MVSVSGACDVWPKPKVALYGVEAVDQQFLDETVEVGVAACGWPRPAARSDPRKGKEKQNGKAGKRPKAPHVS